MRPTTNARGYGHAHQQARADWQPAIDAGNGWCAADPLRLPADAPTRTHTLGATPANRRRDPPSTFFPPLGGAAWRLRDLGGNPVAHRSLRPPLDQLLHTQFSQIGVRQQDRSMLVMVLGRR